MTSAAAATVGRDRSLQIMFGVGGEHDLSERILPHLDGWRASRRCASATAPGSSR